MQIVKVSGSDLDMLLLKVQRAVESGPDAYVRVMTRADGVIVKVNEGVWSAGLGEVEATRSAE
jgi:hypothetical protein